MVRISKQSERRAVSKRRPRPPQKKTGSIKDALPLGYKQHANAVPDELAKMAFVPKIR